MFYQLLPIIHIADTSSTRATKGIGRTQPVNWKDAGEVLGNDALKGCHMPDGTAVDFNPAGAYLQYNEVCTLGLTLRWVY